MRPRAMFVEKSPTSATTMATMSMAIGDRPTERSLVPLARLERARLATNDFEWAKTMLSN